MERSVSVWSSCRIAVFAIASAGLIAGCTSSTEKTVVIPYTNGTTYGAGTTRTISKIGKSRNIKIGEWRYYRPEGGLDYIQRFSDEGELEYSAVFYATGDTSNSTNHSDDMSVWLEYRRDGTIQSRSADYSGGPSIDGLEVEYSEYEYDGSVSYNRQEFADGRIVTRVFDGYGEPVFEGRTDIGAIENYVVENPVDYPIPKSPNIDWSKYIEPDSVARDSDQEAGNRLVAQFEWPPKSGRNLEYRDVACLDLPDVICESIAKDDYFLSRSVFGVCEVDIDFDGTTEYLVSDIPGLCGSGGCHTVLFGQEEGLYREVQNFFGSKIYPAASQTGNRIDLLQLKKVNNESGGGYYNEQIRYAWDGSTYQAVERVPQDKDDQRN